MLIVELRRKTAHLILGGVLIALIWFGQWWVLLIMFPLSLVLASKRLRERYAAFDKYMSKFDRKKARAGVGGAWFVAGALVTWLIFQDVRQVCASLMILTIGDTAAALVGVLVGHTPNPLNPESTLEGSLGGLLFGFLGALLFVPALPAFFGALAAMAIEAVELRIARQRIDDNFLLPLIAAVAMYPFL